MDLNDGNFFVNAMTYLRELNFVTMIIRLLLALFLGGAIGLERGKQGRAAGMRTHILVCLGAALTTMIGFFVNRELGYATDPMRVAAQVVSGIGFLGVGTILTKGRFQITGLTTAAGLWATAAIGIALGAGYYEGAIGAFVIAFLSVTVFYIIESKVSKRQTRFGIYIEINSAIHVRETVDFLTDTYAASGIQVTAPRSGTGNNVGIEANINNPKNRLTSVQMSEELEKLEHVVFAIESI